MNTLRNKVQLIGRLGQEPEIITFSNGNKIAKFSLATDDSYKDKNGDKVEMEIENLRVLSNTIKTVKSQDRIFCIK